MAAFCGPWKGIKAMHWLIWIFMVLYALFQFYKSVGSFLPEIAPEDFSNSYIFHNRKQDITDHEWQNNRKGFLKYWPWLILQGILSQTVFRSFPHLLPGFYGLYSSVFLLWNFGPFTTIVLFAVYLLMYATTIIGSRFFAYLVAVFAISQINFPIFPYLKTLYYSKGTVEGFLTEVGISWTSARCVSFAVDSIQKKNVPNFIQSFSYSFYLPTLFAGPILLYQDYSDQIAAPPLPWNSKRFAWTLFQLTRACLWVVGLEVFTHFCYTSAIAYYPDIVENLDNWSLIGLGYGLIVQFHLKYTIIYGSAIVLSEIEQIYLPSLPKCVSRIHLCSFLWRHFDRGLYLWIMKYIYRPLIAGNWVPQRRIMASLVCFAFVCLWHGMDKSVTTWCSLNFVGISIEIMAGVIMKIPFIKSVEEKYLSETGVEILRAVVGTPHFLFSIISCIFFLSNVDVGLCFIRRVVLGFPLPLIPLLMVMYCGCHVSMDTERWEFEDKKKNS